MASDGWIYTREHPDDPLCPGAGVEISEEGYRRAERVAEQIHEGNVAKGFRERLQNSSELRKHLRGQLAELGGEILTGLPWSASSVWDARRADVGKATEIRSNTYDYQKLGLRAPLVIYPKDLVHKAERAFVLCYPLDETLRRWWFRGWFYAGEAAEHAEWEVLRMGKDKAWEVPAACLNNFPVPEVRERSGRRSRG